MTSFMQRSAKHFLVRKAAREFGKEIEKAGLDNLKTLADAGISIVGTYLNGCAPQEKVKKKRELNALRQMGVTPDMILEEMCRLIPEIVPIMDGRDDYKKIEIQNLELFLEA